MAQSVERGTHGILSCRSLRDIGGFRLLLKSGCELAVAGCELFEG
jgi:hypothetical protein